MRVFVEFIAGYSAVFISLDSQVGISALWRHASALHDVIT